MRIIGVDPGLSCTGYGVIDTPDSRGRTPVAVEGGVCRSQRDDPLEVRILAIYSDIREVLEEHRPRAMALEGVHSRYEYPRTAIIMGHVRGAVCLAAAEAGISVTEYAATRVKNAVTGSGSATKDQVQRAVAAQLGLATPPSPDDVADAFALAICHAMVSGPALAALAQQGAR